jgi:hypothetical protein
MNNIIWFFIGFVFSFILGLPLIIWSLKKGREVYANSRIHGKLGKLFKKTELKKFLDPSMLPKLQKSKYWQIMQFSKSRQEYEKKLENLEKDEFEKIFNLSSSKIKPFLNIYYSLYDEYYDLKLIFYCIKNKRNKNNLKILLKTKKFIRFLKFDYVDDIINELKKDKHFNFLDFYTYKQFGVLGLEYTLDNHYFKLLKNNSKKELRRLYRIVRKNYLLKHIIRLEKLGFKEKDIIKLLKLKNLKEISYVKRDTNIILKEISDKYPLFRQKIVSGENKIEALDFHFQNNVINITSREKLKNPFSMIASFNLFEKIKREIDFARNLWILK